MSKNVKLYSFNIVTVALVAFIGLFTANVVRGQNPRTIDVKINVRIAGEDYYFFRPCHYYDAGIEGGSTWINGNLVTRGNKYLSHIAVGGTIIIVDGTLITTQGLTYPNSISHNGQNYATASVVNAYWKHHVYRDYDEELTGADPSKNCHGYSTGKGVWLDDFTTLMADDYDYCLFGIDLTSGAIVGTSGFGYGDHSILVESVTPTGNPLVKRVVSISEKCRDSGVYRAYIDQPVAWYEIVEIDVPLGDSLSGFYKRKQ